MTDAAVSRPRLQSSAPVFQVRDVDATMSWYVRQLGFAAYPFPKAPPHVFCVLTRDAIEIMLQRVEQHAKRDVDLERAGGVWHVYIRMTGVRAFYDELRARPEVAVVEPLTKQPYGDSEFAVRDPEGYTIVFSELIADVNG